jgi:hypothetical protein
MARFELTDVTVRRRSRAFIFACLAGAVVGALLVGLGLTVSPATLVIGIVAWNLGVWLAVISWGRKQLRAFGHGTLTVDPEGLDLAGQRLLDRAQIAGAYLKPSLGQDGAAVKIRGKAPLLDFEVDVPHEAAGRALLEALGFDPARALVRFTAVSLPMRAWWTQALFAFVFLAAMRFLSATTPWFFLILALPFLILAYTPTRIAVGSDGVRATWLGIGRFIPYREIRRVGMDHEGVYLELEDDRTLHIRTVWPNRGGNFLNAIFESQRESLAERIEQGRAALLAGGAEHASALLQRASKPLAHWLRDLRALGAGANASFRQAAVPEERLWRIVETAGAEGIDRVGAAIALSAQEGTETRARIRIAAEATASPTARAALEAVASGDDERLAEALEAMEAGDPHV